MTRKMNRMARMTPTSRATPHNPLPPEPWARVARMGILISAFPPYLLGLFHEVGVAHELHDPDGRLSGELLAVEGFGWIREPAVAERVGDLAQAQVWDGDGHFSLHPDRLLRRALA